MTDTISRDSLIESARAMKPRLRERAAAVEKNRVVGEDTISDFREAGFFKILQPKTYGGYEMPPEVLMDVIFEVASACGSSGWTLAVLALHQWEVQLLPEDVIAEIWGKDPTILLSSAYAPTGAVVPVEGGYLLNGKFPFSSGCDHAQWAIVGGIRPPRFGGDTVSLCAFFVPRSDYEIIDDWKVMGLCGTGSKTLVINNAFVPDNRQHGIFGDAPAPREGLSATYRVTFGHVFAEMLAAAVHGMAQGMIDQFVERNKKRFATLDRSKYAENPDTHRYIAETEYVVRAARALSTQNIRAAFDAAAGGYERPVSDKARHFWEAARSVHACNEAASKLYAFSGANTIFEGDDLQRLFRDLASATTHMAFGFNGFGRNYGAMQMGHPNTLNLF